MPALVKRIIHSEMAKIFYSAIENKTVRPYYFMGRSEPWPDEENPPTPESGAIYENTLRNDFVRFHAINSADISLMANRVNWVSGTVYDMFDTRYSENYVAPSGATSIYECHMFVVTDDYNVYKCIDNNYNEPSTIKPTSVSSGYEGPLADGYIWKYMKTLSLYERNRLMSSEYYPVSDPITAGSYDGQVNWEIVDGGRGYNPAFTSIVVSGSNGGQGAVLNPVIDGNGTIVNVVAVDRGTGYSTVEIEVVNTEDPLPGNFLPAEIRGIVDVVNLESAQVNVQLSAVPGEISCVYVNTPGLFYDETTTLEIVGDGTGAIVSPVIAANGAINSVLIQNRGQDYSYAELVITDGGLENGSGFTYDIIISPIKGHGASIVEESYASTIVFYAEDLDISINDFILENDYRQVGLIINPHNFDVVTNGYLFNGELGTSCYTLYDESIIKENYEVNQIIYTIIDSERKELRIIAIEDGKLFVQLMDRLELEVGQIIRDGDSSTILFTISALLEPTVDKNSGQIIFIDNKKPFSKNVDQLANIRSYLRF